RQTGARRREVDDRRAGRDLDVAFDRHRDRAPGHGIGNVYVAVDVNSLHRDEQVAGDDMARVVRDPGHLDLTVALEHGARAAGEVSQLHYRSEDNRVVIAEIGGRRFEWGARTYVMGIVNVTPDSFSGDGLGAEVAAPGTQGMRVVGAGGPKEKVIVDPGIGFGKTADQNWEVMRRFSELRELGHPVLVGTSRKSFIGKLLDLPVTERLEGTTATVVGAVLRGADIVRVHDV